MRELAARLDREPSQGWRRERLAAAAAKVGGSAALGRLMKYKSGAQVGHMLSGRRPITEKTVSLIESIHGFAGWFERAHNDQRGNASSSEDAIIRIPLLGNAASMGDGEDALPVDMVAGHFPLSPAWVQQCIPNTATRALRFIHGRGDSMTPTIADGDIVLVDTTQRDPAAMDGVYVLRAADALYIKRVYQNLRGKLEVSSDNPAIKTVDVLDGTHEVEVLGRVIWVWGGRRV